MCGCCFRYCHQLLTCDIDQCCTQLLQSLTLHHSTFSHTDSQLHRPVRHSVILVQCFFMYALPHYVAMPICGSHWISKAYEDSNFDIKHIFSFKCIIKQDIF